MVFYKVLLIIGTLVLVLGLLSSFLKKTILSLPLLSLITGIVLSPSVLNVLNPFEWGNTNVIIEETARLTIAIGLLGVALRLPRGYFVKQWKSLMVLLVFGMPLMAFSGGLITWAIFGVSWQISLLIGAIISPTDPIVATTIVTGTLAEEKIPHHVRHTISAESGANDGLAYPLVMLPILFMKKNMHEAWISWFFQIVLWEIGGSIIIGIIAGLTAGYFLKMAEKFKIIEKTSFLAQTLALVLFTLGFAKILKMDGILAVFTAGLSFDYVIGAKERAEEENVQEAVNIFFTLPIFVLLGLVLPWNQWIEMGWKSVLFGVAILLFRRLPSIMMIYKWIPSLKYPKDALFAGWFGPIGIAALLYSVMALKQSDSEQAWALGTLAIFSSLIIHGITAAPFTVMYGNLIYKKSSTS